MDVKKSINVIFMLLVSIILPPNLLSAQDNGCCKTCWCDSYGSPPDDLSFSAGAVAAAEAISEQANSDDLCKGNVRCAMGQALYRVFKRNGACYYGKNTPQYRLCVDFKPDKKPDGDGEKPDGEGEGEGEGGEKPDGEGEDGGEANPGEGNGGQEEDASNQNQSRSTVLYFDNSILTFKYNLKDFYIYYDDKNIFRKEFDKIQRGRTYYHFKDELKTTLKLKYKFSTQGKQKPNKFLNRKKPITKNEKVYGVVLSVVDKKGQEVNEIITVKDGDKIYLITHSESRLKRKRKRRK